LDAVSSLSPFSRNVSKAYLNLSGELQVRVCMQRNGPGAQRRCEAADLRREVAALWDEVESLRSKVRVLMWERRCRR